ncbi:MAG TPA: GNAT family N-acetyltransferase [Streptosporangiaceae bacterium]
MDIRPVTSGDLAAVARLCEAELVLDRDAAALPGVLAQGRFVGLLALQGSRPIGACFGSLAAANGQAPQGFIDLIVVDRAEQRRGVGRRLLAGMERQLASMGCERVAVAGNGTYYAWPGIDVHYTAAVCFAEDLGYRRTGCEVNMDVDLLRVQLDTEADEERLRRAGILIRPATARDDGWLQDSLAPTWIAAWVAELETSLRSDAAGLHIAIQGGRCIGFCAHGIRHQHEIGPVGTHPDVRRMGIGGVLLRRCMRDLRERGLTVAELGWAGPLPYFSRSVQATIGRVFWLYEKDLLGRMQGPDWRARVGLI